MSNEQIKKQIKAEIAAQDEWIRESRLTARRGSEVARRARVSCMAKVNALHWVLSPASLDAGLRGTDVLTKFKAGKTVLYSLQECEALHDSITAAAILATQAVQGDTAGDGDTG